MEADIEVLSEALSTDIALPETTLCVDRMYDTIGKTLHALDNITVDGEGSIDADLQAHTHKRYLPDTEIEMLHTQAVPMSDEDIKAKECRRTVTSSLQYRQEQLKIPSKTLAEITGARIRIAYRLVRYLSHIKGIGAVGNPLIFSMATSNAQMNLYEMPMVFDPTEGHYRGLANVRNLLTQADEGGYAYTYHIGGKVYSTGGMSVLPPPLHDGYFPNYDEEGKALWQYRREEYTPQGYKASCDNPLSLYLNICELLVRHLGIADVDVDEQAAVAALLNPTIARLAWPCRDDLETFEESVLMPYLGRIVVKGSQESAIETLKKDMGMTHTEAFDLVESYKTYSMYANTFDPEKEKSIMLSRLQSLAQDCNEAQMVTTQLNTYKVTSQILGLTKHDEDANIDKRVVLESALETDMEKHEQKRLSEQPEQIESAEQS